MKAILRICIMLLILLSVTPAVFGRQKATDFALTDLYGQQFSLSDYLGKVVLIDFFATSCIPCRQEMLELRSLWEKNSSEQFIMISLSLDDSHVTQEDLLDFVREYDMKWIVARDVVGVSVRYGITAIPTLVMVDSDGYVAYSHVGVTAETVLIQEVKSLLSPATSSVSQTSITYQTIGTIGFCYDYQVWYLAAISIVVVAFILLRRMKQKNQISDSK